MASLDIISVKTIQFLWFTRKAKLINEMIFLDLHVATTTFLADSCNSTTLIYYLILENGPLF